MSEHVKIAELQEQIRAGIDIAESNILFEFIGNSTPITLEIVTVNPKHKQSFLFHTCTGRDKIDALENMLEYVEKTKSKFNSYTLQWSLLKEDQLHTSYFRAKNIMDALEKFYFKKDINSVNVFSIVLNPIS